MSFIDDPASGRRARVNKENRVSTEAVTRPDSLHETEKGLGFNLNSGLVGLTNSTATPILYLENHEDHPIVIEALAVGLDDLGTHTGSPVITMIRNPTSIDFSAAADMKQNRNFASSTTLKTATLVYKGAVGNTVTGGDDIAIFLQQESGRLFAPINFVLGVGNSVCVTVDAQVTSGTCQVYAALIVYIAEEQ
jgi:hypothetical protein